ncbi:hypothetical protein B0J17DRAFT_685387 [Rhizoctonia solani]|nr:hypothetical protein B0J17DRAFT_685387 [Rhizoctonia solani]
MKTRQQTRLLGESNREGKQHGVTGPPESVGSDRPADSNHGDLPQRKKRSLTTASELSRSKPPNKIKGKLSGVLALPIEVFMEIIQYLALPDVLSLSRSNKFFRQMLMTRSAATLFVWRTAVQNVPGLPPCPKDLCEPQYAALIYSKHCSMCGTSVVRPMDPYLNVRLCKDCTEIHIIHINELEDPMLGSLVYQSSITRMKASRYGMQTCLIRDVEEMRKWHEEVIKNDAIPDEELQVKIEGRFDDIVDRVEYAQIMEEFLRDMAEARTREIDQLKEQRRQDVKRRLEEAGWEEPDWTFPEFVARKWGPLVEGPQALTERAWQKLYPNLVPYLEKNRESHRERSKIVRERKRLRRMRRLLLAIRNSSNLLEVDPEGVADNENGPDNASVSATTANDTTANSPAMSDYEANSATDNNSSIETETPNPSDPNITSITVRATFPPMVDLLKWPIISKLLKDDTDADTMQERFEGLKDEIEEQIRSWRSTVEKELVDTLQVSTTGNTSSNGSEDGNGLMVSGSKVPRLQLKTKLPPTSSFMDHLTPDTQLLLRADSVFRASEDTIAPMPLYFPELFHILQDRPDGYCSYDFRKLDGYERPKHGYTWDLSEVAYYPEGTMAAKALLRDLARVDAAQFELQALGARFTCGLCGDKWPRTWNEMVQHYAEAIVHTSTAAKAKASVKARVKYDNAHVSGLDDKPKGKRKPTVVLHSAEEAKALSAKHRRWEYLVKCKSCEELGVDFRSPRNIMLKHVRAVHSVKAPKAETYERGSGGRIHTQIDDPMGAVSDSTEGTDQEKVKDLRTTFSHYGTYVFWSYYGPHKLHPGWDRRDF